MEKKWTNIAIIIASTIVFITDWLTPIGSADYVFYFVPVALGIFQSRMKVPLIVAMSSSVLLLAGYYISPESEVDSQIAFVNRFFAAAVIWVSALLVLQALKGRQTQQNNTWVKTGLSQLAVQIRGELSEEEIGKSVLSFLNSYTQSLAGAIYLKQEGRDELSLLVGHAIDRQLPNSIKMGEGFVGQAFQDKTAVELVPVPAGYFSLCSSLGQASPDRLKIIPLLVEDEVLGVLELAYLNDEENDVPGFLDEIGQLVGVALRSAQHKKRLASLLKDAQSMNERLQTQQEELRVVNEELEQQGRALKESHTRMENQQAELEQTNQQLEEQTQKLEQQAELLDASNRELRDSQKALEDKTRELETSSRYKSEFMANMSHELRTPLNSSLILAKLLADNKEGNLTAEQIEYARVIHSSGNDLLNLINDILDLSKVESGKLTIQPIHVSLASIQHSLEQLFMPIARQKGLDLSFSLDENLPKEITTDPMRLEQILKNLLSNAIKFTQHGSVALSVKRSGNSVDFVVKDTGVGIKPEEQEVIFEAFRQADGTTNRKFGGTGLGLSISRELAKLLGGRISVSSKPGEGSVFTLHLPEKFSAQSEVLKRADVRETSDFKINKEPEAKEIIRFSFEDDRHSKIKQRKILIIEDDEPFAKILFDLAREMSFNALVSPTADEGLLLAQEHVPDAVILDIRLPDHSGLIVLDQLKQNPRTRHIPVHVISSSDHSMSAKEMGAVGYAIKPVKIETLKVVFQNITSFVNQTQKQVLVVEDDPIQNRHIVDLISDKDVKVDSVATATEALERLATRTYDCMIMDLTLPDLPGYELLAKLSSERERYSYPPVIVYTARDLTREEEEKLRNYSGSIIIKGAKSPERLLNEVTLFLHRVESDLPPERQKMLKDLRSRDRGLQNKTILAVDDDVRNIFALTSALEHYGANIIVARNGQEALDQVLAHPEIDLILMDIMMPVMDGYEAMTRIRKDKSPEALPIIALTAKTMKDDQAKCLAAGANDYLSKPLDVDKLLSLIRVWLPSKRSF